MKVAVDNVPGSGTHRVSTERRDADKQLIEKGADGPCVAAGGVMTTARFEFEIGRRCLCRAHQYLGSHVVQSPYVEGLGFRV